MPWEHPAAHCMESFDVTLSLASYLPVAQAALPAWLQLVWVAMLGACTGSFLNVVVYRLPRGKSVVYPPSACPACGHAIRWHDNVPVFGWLLLRGRCRDCRAPISPRYPLVEAAVAAMFAVLALVEPVWGGVNLPHALADAPILTPAELWVIAGYHGVLLCVLLALGLIELDGDNQGSNRFVWGLVLWSVLLGLAVPVAMSGLRPVAMEPAGATPWWTLVEGLIGGVAGLLAASTALPAVRFGPWQHRGRWFAWGAGLLVGVYLGWQAAAALVLVNCYLYLVLTLVGRVRPRWLAIPWSLTFVPVTLAWIAFWQTLYAWLPAIGSAPIATQRIVFLVALAAALVASLTSAPWRRRGAL